MATAIRSFAWDTTPLGPMVEWSDTLITSVNLILASPYPSMLLWGEQMVMLYNDAFIPLLTDRHPALGRLGRAFWTDVWPVVGEQLEAVVRDGRVFLFEKALVPILTNGILKDTWFDYSYTPVYDPQGKICGLLDVCQDVTGSVIAERDRAAAEEALRQRTAELDRTVIALHTERARLLNVLQQAPIFFALLQGPEHIFAMANPLYMKLVGNRDILGKSVADAIPEVVAQGYVDMLNSVYNTGEQVSMQSAVVEIVRSEGAPPERRYLDFSYAPLRDADNSISGVIVLGIDQTEAQQAHKALLQSEKLAAVGRLAASIAHEINNPLESVTNLLFLARNSEALPQVHDYLDTAEVELRRVSAITHQTLSFHKQSSTPRVVSCLDLIGSVVNIYQSRLANAGIAVEKRKRAAQSVLCYDGEIRQVLNNLVANSIDAMPRGGRLILRSRDARDPRNGVPGVVLTIADTGSGIPAENLRHIFEAFFTTKGLGGTGLGLWLSADIIHRHHGTLRVRSSQKPGRSGTVFAVFLPLDGAKPRTGDPARP